jgi:flavodoxin
MSKILVAYFSRTGNTKKGAETIHGEIEGDRTLATIDKTGPLEAYDLIFVGFPVQSHSLPFPVETFLKSLPKGKKIALFSTHGAFPHHRMALEAIEYAAVLSSHSRLLGTFHCRGKLSLQALDVLARSPEHREWSEMAPSAASHPDAHDLAEAAIFARHMKARSAETTGSSLG